MPKYNYNHPQYSHRHIERVHTIQPCPICPPATLVVCDNFFVQNNPVPYALKNWLLRTQYAAIGVPKDHTLWYIREDETRWLLFSYCNRRTDTVSKVVEPGDRTILINTIEPGYLAQGTQFILTMADTYQGDLIIEPIYISKTLLTLKFE